MSNSITTIYLFTSENLGFRLWRDIDLLHFSTMNADPRVMQHFPKTISIDDSENFMHRMNDLYALKGYCYFAVDELKSGLFIGFIGLSEKSFKAPFNPSIDIGWRLAFNFWNKGYATEGAKRVLTFAWENLKLFKITSIAPLVNVGSIRIMEKVGMHKLMEFNHPQLLDYKNLVNCICYEIKRDSKLSP